MESNATSLKKLKREAAQRRKAQARSLKLRAEEQERLQRLEIDALVEQQRLQRLERQRRKEDAEKLAHEAAQRLSLQSNIPFSGNETHTKGKQYSSGSGQVQTASSNKGGGEEGRKPSKESSAGHKEGKPASKQVISSNNTCQQAQLQKQQQEELQQQQLRAIAENRGKLAKGSSSRGVLDPVVSSVAAPLVAGIPATSNGSASVLPSEDHRVVSTEYQAAGTQALMRVTLLAAGFVIGARGISARLIGQMTGAIIQSWTEPTACRPGNVNGSSPNGVPIRLFRIQGKKSVVQAAVSLVEQAVAKYRELCECKRRGEFVQREHVINGVEFYYQPPPRKAFVVPEHGLANGSRTSPPSTAASAAPSPGNIAPALSGTISATPDVPLANSIHHVWLHHLHQKQAQLQKQKEQAEQVQENKTVNLEDVCESPASDGFSAVQAETQSQQQRPSTAESLTGSAEANHGTPAAAASAWGTGVTSEQQQQQQHVFQEESSLFSIFGNGGLPLPIAQDCPPPNAQLLKSSVSSTPFDFPKYDFFREVLPAFPPPFQTPGEEYNLFSHHQLHHLAPVQPPDKQPLVVCVERPPPRFVEQ